ncbi:MAG: hypothetical protein KJ977_05320 [Candidatus Omnitrophica bacterium]|nr:hypothetical protein [Candidatus Omnitrophota bacterium]
MTTHTSPPSPPRRHRLPDDRPSITHKFTIAGADETGRPLEHEGYLTVGLYEDGSPGEVFVRFAKLGGREGALLDAWCTMVSIGLQCGMPITVAIEKFRGWKFEPAGLTRNTDIRMVSSPLDYIVRWLDLRFSKEKRPTDASPPGE